MVLGFLFLLIYGIFTYLLIRKIYYGESFYLLLYILFFLPVYSVFQLIVFKITQNFFFIDLIKYSKDFVIFSSFFVLIFGNRKSIINRKFQITFLDKLVIFFIGISIIYAFIPLGPASLFVKAVYLKNILLIGIVYFIGKNTNISLEKFKFLKKALIGLFLLAFFISTLEYLLGAHLHSILDYANYNLLINDIEPTGNFGLSWTFERGPDHPRFASFFSNPLEYSANLLLFLTIPLFHLIHNSKNRGSYFFLLIIAGISFYYAYSRASIISGFLMIILALIMNKNFKTIINLFLVLMLFSFIFYLSDSEEMLYYIIDTFTFNESSSLSHLLEWIQAGISIFENPFGIGLAMSGNATGVDQAIKIGGENQFLIYGVQMGIVSLLIYSLMLFKAIKDSIDLYKSSNDYKKELSFLVGLTKFGLLIPLFTANVELYIFISLFSWFLVGHIQKLKLEN